MSWLLIHIITLSLAQLSIAQPLEWLPKVRSYDWLYSPKAEPDRYSPALGNGNLATVVFTDTVYLAGLYEGNKTSVHNPSHRARIPSPLNLVVVSVDGLLPNQTDCALDMESGRYFQRTNAIVEQIVYIHRAKPYLLLHEVRSVKGEHEVCFYSNTGLPSPEINFTKAFSRGNYSVYQGWTQFSENGTVSQIVLIVTEPAITREKSTRIGQIPSWHLCETVTPQKPFIIYSAIAKDTPIEDLEKAFMEDLKADPAKLMQEHIEEWKRLRESGGHINVKGFPLLSKAVNASLYELLVSLDRKVQWSNSPGGLPTNYYNGHVFWDFETWMFPSLAVLFPDLARNGLLYRYHRLDGARAKAKENGYSGAMWPWESAFSGQEVTPTFALTGLLEHHISGDIIFAAKQWFSLHRDNEMLENVLCKIAKETAEYWASRVEEDAKGAYHILNIIPPDEYAQNVSDSVFTNTVAKITLDFANRCSYNATWERISKNLFILYDKLSDIHPEYLGYKWGNWVKQADVTLLAFPLEEVGNYTTALHNLEYYKKFTAKEGPAMTWPIFFIESLDLASIPIQVKEAIGKYFYKSFLLHSKGPYMIWWEDPEGGATHFVTGAGGFLQCFVYGFAGLRAYYDKENPQILAKFKPFLPVTPLEEIEVLGMRLLNGTVKIDVKLSEKTYFRVHTKGLYMKRKSNGKSYTLVEGEWVEVPSDISLSANDFYYLIKDTNAYFSNNYK